MKKVLSIVLVEMACMSGWARYAWTLTPTMTAELDDVGNLTVEGTGDMPMWDGFRDVPWYNVSYLIKSATIASGITSIGSSAFADCPSLRAMYVNGKGGIDEVRRMVRESGFEVDSVTFDHVERYLTIFCVDGIMSAKQMGFGEVYALPPCMQKQLSGKRFAGWACSNGRRYDDGMLVFNLAEPGETVTMTAIWE